MSTVNHEWDIEFEDGEIRRTVLPPGVDPMREVKSMCESKGGISVYEVKQLRNLTTGENYG